MILEHKPTRVNAYVLTHPLMIPEQPTPQRRGEGDTDDIEVIDLHGHRYFLPAADVWELYNPVDDEAKHAYELYRLTHR